jgi:hypothetical protein
VVARPLRNLRHSIGSGQGEVPGAPRLDAVGVDSQRRPLRDRPDDNRVPGAQPGFADDEIGREFRRAAEGGVVRGERDADGLADARWERAAAGAEADREGRRGRSRRAPGPGRRPLGARSG